MLERNAGLLTVNDLLHLTRDELAATYEVGPALIREVFDALAVLGFDVDAALAAMRLPKKYRKPIIKGTLG